MSDIDDFSGILSTEV